MTADFAPSAQLLQLLPEAVVQTDALRNITYLNPAWHKLTGHAVDAVLGRSLLDFVHPDDTGTLRSGMPVFRLRFADSDYRWMRLQLHPESDAANRVVSRQGVLLEITEVTEQVLVEVRQRFLRLLETIDGAVWEAERGVGNTFLSPQVESLFGYTVEEWRSDPGFWRAHVHPDDLPAALVIDDAAYNATHSYAYEMSYRLCAKSGKVVWVRDLCRVVVEDGRPNRMIGLMIDVTRQKSTELELLQSDNRYSLATRGSNDGIWDGDLQADVLHVSERFREIVGLGDAGNLHDGGWRFLQQLIDPDDRERVQAAYRRHLSGGQPELFGGFPCLPLGGTNGVGQLARRRPVRGWRCGADGRVVERSCGTRQFLRCPDQLVRPAVVPRPPETRHRAASERCLEGRWRGDARRLHDVRGAAVGLESVQGGQ